VALMLMLPTGSHGNRWRGAGCLPLLGPFVPYG
jgi:hypothetical protein